MKEKLERRAVLREEKVRYWYILLDAMFTTFMKAILQLLLKISDSITRLESLLLISSPSEGSSPEQITFAERSYGGEEAVDEKYLVIDMPSAQTHYPANRSKGNRAKHLLRIATEYNQLLYHSSKASSSSCMFVTETQWVCELHNRRAIQYH